MNHYKETIRLGVPIMLGQLGIIIVGFADNIMVGHHSTQELAAASFVNNFFKLAQPTKRVISIYHSVLYSATLLGCLHHAVQFVQAIQRRND